MFDMIKLKQKRCQRDHSFFDENKYWLLTDVIAEYLVHGHLRQTERTN